MKKLEIGKSMSPDYEGRTKITDYIDYFGRICPSCVASQRGSPSGFLFLLWLITLPCVLQICKVLEQKYFLGVGFWIIYGLLLCLGHRMQKASIEKQARKEGLYVSVCYYHSAPLRF